MSSKQLLYAQGIVAVTVGILHLLGLEYFLYWKLWWYDILLHLLGGMWVGFGVLWLAALIRVRMTLGVVLLGVLVVGGAWELWEVWAGLFPVDNHLLDTVLDLIMDLCGGALAVWVTHVIRARADVIIPINESFETP